MYLLAPQPYYHPSSSLLERGTAYGHSICSACALKAMRHPCSVRALQCMLWDSSALVQGA